MKQRLTFILVAVAAAFSLSLSAQEQTFVIDPEAPYEVYVDGTSTLHDWTAQVGTVKDYPARLTLAPASGGTVASFGFKAEVNSMDGGRGSTMNGKIQKALKSDAHPDIVYEQAGPARITTMPDGQLKLQSSGSLSMAGVKKDVTVEVMGMLNGGKLVFKGSKALKMSDFNIEAPSALFGQIQTYDDITVHFTFNYVMQ